MAGRRRVPNVRSAAAPQGVGESITEEQLRSEVETWAKKIGVQPKSIEIAPLKRKWGEYHTSGTIRLNSELLNHPKQFRDMVIAHELLHGKLGGSHGRLFRVMLDAYLAQGADDVTGTGS
jgi:predicted metal-dependent hydrolase